MAFPPLAAEKLLGGQEGSIVFVGRGAGAIQSCGLPREVVSDQTAPQIRRVGSATRISIRRFFVKSTRQIVAKLSWRSWASEISGPDPRGPMGEEARMRRRDQRLRLCNSLPSRTHRKLA